jgi:FAD binding domain
MRENSFLDGCDEIYIDQVCQIQMESWSRGRVALVGDAAFAPSLLAGQGSALAMIAAYVLAGELARKVEPEIAFRRYEQLLHVFMSDKKKAARGFARSFAPKTRLGLLFRNQVMKAFAIPGLAPAVIGPGLLDRIDLPDRMVTIPSDRRSHQEQKNPKPSSFRKLLEQRAQLAGESRLRVFYLRTL